MGEKQHAQGASFTAVMVLELASTNLVIELGLILIVLPGWQFMAANTHQAKDVQ